MQKVNFIPVNAEDNQFFSVLRKRVDAYFRDNNISKYGNNKMVIKTIILLSFYILPYVVMLITNPSTLVSIIIWSVMGFALAGIGMSIMHDANHGSYSKNSRVNYWMGNTLNLLGGSVFNWKMQHNLLHHTFTNVVDMDDDIDDKLIMRFSPHTEVKWYHRFQFVYAFLFYTILTLYWVVAKDFVQFYKYKKEKVNKESAATNRMILFKMFLVKIGYIFCFMILPIFLLNMDATLVICGFLLMQAIAGLVLTVIFQLAHTVENTSHPLPDANGTIENNWAVHQLNTTVNFSRENKFLSWYLGGLNYQVEHHLFPTICHVHYPEISKIVKATANEYNVPYLENDTFLDALGSHVRTLKRLGGHALT